jgi:hypothetical protein
LCGYWQAHSRKIIVAGSMRILKVAAIAALVILWKDVALP